MNKFQLKLKLDGCTVLVVVALAAVFVNLNVYVGALSLNEPVSIIEKDAVLFEDEHVLASASPTQPQPLLVALTLIDNAASKGAGPSLPPFISVDTLCSLI